MIDLSEVVLSDQFRRWLDVFQERCDDMRACGQWGIQEFHALQNPTIKEVTQHFKQCERSIQGEKERYRDHIKQGEKLLHGMEDGDPEKGLLRTILETATFLDGLSERFGKNAAACLDTFDRMDGPLRQLENDAVNTVTLIAFDPGNSRPN